MYVWCQWKGTLIERIFSLQRLHEYRQCFIALQQWRTPPIWILAAKVYVILQASLTTAQSLKHFHNSHGDEERVRHQQKHNGFLYDSGCMCFLLLQEQQQQKHFWGCSSKTMRLQRKNNMWKRLKLLFHKCGSLRNKNINVFAKIGFILVRMHRNIHFMKCANALKL